MKFGFCLMPDVTDIGFFSHAEALGYSSVWVADSQMLFSDCLRGAGPGGAANESLAYRSRDGDLRHAHRAGAGGGDGDAERARAWPGVSGHWHRQHGDAHDGPETDEDGGLFGVSARPRRVAARRNRRLHVRGRDETGEAAASRGARHAAGSANSFVCLRVRSARDGAGGRARRRHHLRHSAARRAGRGGLVACASGRRTRQPLAWKGSATPH